MASADKIADNSEVSGRASRRSRARAWAFRGGALLLGLMPFLLVEGFLVLLDIGRPEVHGDPFVGFRGVRPLFVLDGTGERYMIPPSRQAFFRPESFPAKKPPGEYRIFCLGGSTVQGNPFTIETSFTTWLEIALKTARPDRSWDVINCGGVSYASYRLIPILEEVLQYEPDLIIVYTGQNEFLEDRTYQHIKHRPEWISEFQELAFQSRLLTLTREAYVNAVGVPDKAAAPVLPEEVEAMLDYRGGLSYYERDEKWRRDVVQHFEFNLRRMVQLAGEADVPLILCNPVTNLRDCAPFKSQHREGLSEEERQRWQALWEQARKYFDKDMAKATSFLETALAIDDHHAGLWFELGKCYDVLGEYEKAYKAYVMAQEMDVCPLRIIEPMHAAIFEVTAETGTPLLDVRQMFERESRDGIPGGWLLVDHVHPSIDGHQMIARALLELMVALKLIPPPAPDWDDELPDQFAAHLESLDDFYFLKGEQRLKALRNWAAGRAIRFRQEE